METFSKDFGKTVKKMVLGFSMKNQVVANMKENGKTIREREKAL